MRDHLVFGVSWHCGKGSCMDYVHSNPAHEGQVVYTRGLHDVVHGIVENGDRARDADDDQRLAGKHRKDNGSEHRSQ